MQITINTADILGDEVTIRDEIISQVSAALTTSMRQQANAALSEMLEKNVADLVSRIVAETVSLTIDAPFTDIDSYGRVGKTASIRERIADYVQAQCAFGTKTYSSDENTFTKTVKKVVEAEVAKFKTEFNSLVTRQVVEQSADAALKKLKESLGIKP